MEIDVCGVGTMHTNFGEVDEFSLSPAPLFHFFCSILLHVDISSAPWKSFPSLEERLVNQPRPIELDTTSDNSRPSFRS